MFIIRKDQIKNMQQSKEDQFIKKSRLFLQFKYPEKSKQFSDKQLNEVVKNGINRASAYDINSEQSVIAFLELMFSLSFDFDDHPRTIWTKTILTNDNLNESDKIMNILKKINT